MGAPALQPPVAAAAGEASQLLPGVTVTALTTDLDRDGDREIVRLVQEDAGGLEYAADAWDYDGAQWSMVASVALPGGTADEEGSVAGGLARALLLWQDGGRQRVLVLLAEVAAGDRSGAMCCLTISELQLSRGGDLELNLLQRLDAGAQSIWSADVDGDGSDELVLHQGWYGATEDEQTATVQVLRWGGTTFEPVFEQTDRQFLYGFAIGDTDGVAGEDLLIGPGSDRKIRRLAWAGGEVRQDEAPLDAGDPPEGWIAGVADGAIVVSLRQEALVLRWPRGEDPTIVGRLETPGFPGISLVGDGPDALIVVQTDFGTGGGPEPSVTVHDLGLQLFGEVGFSLGGDLLWRLFSGQVSLGGVQHNIYPYSGPIHGGVGDDRAAYVSSGMLIQPGGPDGYEARPMASLIGVQPIGLAGPEDGWVALGGNYSPPPGAAYLNWGGIPPEWGRLVVMPVDQLLQPDDQASGVSVELVGAVEIALDGEPELMADGDGFQVAITAPEGSVVIVLDGPLADEHEVAAEPLLVEVGPRSNRQDDENQEFERTLLIVTPDGRGITRQWSGTFVREPPTVSVRASTDAMALSATLTGRASPGSSVNADGVAIETDDDGRFTASIDAPIWPSRVLVTARDPLGNEVTEVVEVVGLVDYRGLPWAAILVVATVLVGGVLFIRTPKRRAAAALPDGDGQLEELELDAVDGSEPGGR